jgi:cold shock protein
MHGNFRYSLLGAPIEERIVMPQGTVKMFKMDKGFGFIKPDGGGDDIFVLRRELEKTGISSLVPGQKVTFDVEPDKTSGRPRAVNVRIAE